MKQPLIVPDTIIAIKLVTGEELICRVTGVSSEYLSVKDARTLTANGNGIGLIPSFPLGGELQKGTYFRDKIVGIYDLSEEHERQYLGNVSGLQL